ncbi:T9SS type A sorting domain-containing protein [Tenacibaculum ovolyticum]|uniref:T9SS type A sorting domain-containing protein n=1 Tax=Tenacibaculum ovolyticum TaxID=104270 RepID=UPI00041BD304|nr:T9SS type A sorting domain-containing protein [Tenacibaculum ovolyticum]
MIKKLSLLFFVLFNYILYSQETNIPDATFETYLETHDATGAIVPLNDPASMGNGVIDDNKVTTANIINVEVLNIANLGISNLTGIEDFTALEELNSSSNLLTQINLTKNTALKNLYLTSNKLTSLDLKFNTALFQVAVADNDLILLDVRNGQNGLIGTFDARANYDLECILVDNPSLSSLVLWKADTAVFSEHGNETNIPDAAFETYLETHDANGNTVTLGDATSMGNGIADDDYVYTSAIKNVTTLSINGSFVPPGQVADPATIVSDATGIEDFIALEELSLNRNELVSIDLSKNTALVILSLRENKLKSINLSKNIRLENLNLSKNELTELDVTLHTALTSLSCDNNELTVVDLSNNSLLTTLFCSRNGLTSLNVTQNTVLTKLSCYDNPIGNLDVTKNLLLEDLDCVDTQLTNLDVTLNTKLTVLQCYENTLTSLDVTKNTALLELYCSSNQIISLDLTQNPLLGEIELQDNALTSLNLKNGNNINLDVEVQDNPNLYCILVDDATAMYLNSKTWDKDAQAYYSTDCRVTNVPDTVFENYLETHTANGTTVTIGDPTSMGNGVANDKIVTTEKIENVKSLDVNNKSIFSLAGIEDFLALEELRCFKNSLTALDVSQNTALTYLNCSRNEIESLDVTKNTALIKLSCYTNPIGSLDVTLNTLLESLDCVENELTTLNVTQNINLETLYTYENELTSLDVSKNTKLVYFYTEYNQIISLDVSHNPLLDEFSCSYNALTSLNIKNGNNTNLDISDFDIRGNPNLICVTVDDPAYADAKLVNKDAQTLYKLDCRQTFVPDTIFENYLETHDADGNTVTVGNVTSMGNGIANDDYVYTSAIENVTLLELPYTIPAPGGIINPATQVSDITGLEDFIALITLDIRFQNIATLDVTSNINLEKLTCFTSEVSTLDISTNTKLEELTFVSNKITRLDVSNNTLLKKIYATGNSIAEVDFSTNILLDWIYLSKNELRNIDLSHNSLLEKLLLNDNLLVNLDLSANSKLENIQIQNNQLTTVNIKNGNNGSITSFEATNNPNLTCIEVDNTTEVTAGTGNYASWNKDVTASYNEDCSFSVWSGNTSSDWNVSTNWSNNTAPLATDNVFIPNVVTAPTINGGITVEVNSLTVNAASEFNIASDGAAVITSDFMNNGTVSITSTVNNSGVLFVKGTANGQVTYERGGLIGNEWSIVSAPISGQSIKEFAENPLNNIRVNTTVTPNRYAIGYYDDSKATGTKWTYYTTDDLTTNALTFEKGRSYAISRTTNGSVLFTGTIETANVTKLVAASEWNAIGNPYTTFLPINENGGTNFVNANTAKLNPANVGVYVWDNVQGKYTGRSLVTAESSLAPGQGFFIKTTTGVSSIVFNEAQRKVQPLTGGNFSRGTTKTKTPSIQLLAKSKEATINTTIKYFDTATKGLDPGYDLGNYERASFDVFTRLVASENSQDFTIQSLPKSTYEEMSIPIGIKSEANKEISFAINALDLPEGVEVFIEDKDKNTFTKLDAEGKLSYKAEISKKVNGIGRFYLHTKQNDLAEVPSFNSVKIYTIANKSLMIKGISKGNVEVVLYNINGAVIFRKTVKAKGENILNNLNVPIGVYIVKVQSNQGVHTKKISIN